jgi:hypothetical protein
MNGLQTLNPNPDRPLCLDTLCHLPFSLELGLEKHVDVLVTGLSFYTICVLNTMEWTARWT